MAIAFYGFLLVALNWIVGWNIYDLTLMPRLLALMVFLVLAVPVFAFSKASKKSTPPFFAIRWSCVSAATRWSRRAPWPSP